MDVSIFWVLFLALAPGLMAVRLIWRRPSWWLITPIIVLGGWGAYFLAVIDHYDTLQQQIAETPNPDPALLERAYADGAPLVFAAFGGWVAAVAYALPWLCLFGVLAWIGRLRRG